MNSRRTIVSRPAVDAELFQRVYDEAKAELAHEVATQLDDLIDKLDVFLEVRIKEEFEELVADLLEHNRLLQLKCDVLETALSS